jgi:hypothetical protein
VKFSCTIVDTTNVDDNTKDVLLEMPDVGADADFERISDVARPVEL